MIELKNELQKYLIKNFEPLNTYIDNLNKRIKCKINEDVDNNGGFFEYLDLNNKRIRIFINSLNDGDKYISFYIYNEFLENTEMIDFLLKNNEDKSIIRYSAIFYENDLAKIINSGYTYKNNELIKGWIKKYVINKEIGNILATSDNLANLSCHIENDINIDIIEKYEENSVKKLKLYF